MKRSVLPVKGDKLHPHVWLLGIVSFLTDVSSEMIFSVFAVAFTRAGASASLLGVGEGLADASASSLDALAGWLSDRTGKSKLLALLGYGFSTAAKALLLVGSSVSVLGFFRVVERLGKSFRGPPRDAWLAALSSAKQRGYAFGVHKTLDKAGAVLGPLVAAGVLSVLGESLQSISKLFVIAIVPAVLAVVVLAFVPARQDRKFRESPLASWKALSPAFKGFLFPAGLFALSYFSFGFLLIKAHAAGFSAGSIALLYALFNLAFVIASAPLGRLGDIIGRKKLLMSGWLLYAAIAAGFAFTNNTAVIIILFVLYGVFYTIDEAQAKAYIADLEPERRASAIGAYNMLMGFVYLAASVLAGALWMISPAVALSTAAIVALAAVAVFALKN